MFANLRFIKWVYKTQMLKLNCIQFLKILGCCIASKRKYSIIPEIHLPMYTSHNSHECKSAVFFILKNYWKFQSERITNLSYLQMLCMFVEFIAIKSYADWRNNRRFKSVVKATRFTLKINRTDCKFKARIYYQIRHRKSPAPQRIYRRRKKFTY